jgi:hypothetical protein
MASRDITAGVLAAIQAGNVRPAIFYQGEFVDGSEVTQYLRLWTGIGPRTWNGSTWTGGGHLLNISVIEESGEIKAVGFDVTMSGLSSARISQALQSARRNRPGHLWLVLFDASGNIIPDPYLLKRGKFSMIPIEDNGETCTVTAKYEDRLINLQKPREMRYTTESQKLRDPDDLGFEFVEALQDATFALG